MTVVSLHPKSQKRTVVLTAAGAKWRASIIPPQPHAEPELPQHSDFDLPDEALGYACRLAFKCGWRVVDQTGRRTPEEIEAAIHYAGTLDLDGDA